MSTVHLNTVKACLFRSSCGISIPLNPFLDLFNCKFMWRLTIYPDIPVQTDHRRRAYLDRFSVFYFCARMHQLYSDLSAMFVDSLNKFFPAFDVTVCAQTKLIAEIALSAGSTTFHND